ncbi:uncharacterized protein LOC123508086 [Portunus trituberculatus]|uniref:uncharacterized protein LOC123508086 n=1 Tax=Portunus trituberculatus TaxID=210409 RepID=UPI001E1CEBE4|nr:uncharacterized protein LOC123508086 [Portunus trituberculatus]
MTPVSPRRTLYVLALLLLPLLLLQTPASDATVVYMFRKVFVSPIMVNSSKSESLCHGEDTHHVGRCSGACTMHEWCQLWCSNSPLICTLYSALVMPTYRDASPDDSLVCYTRRPMDLATGAKPFMGTMHEDSNVSTLVDGIYDMQQENCFKTKKANGHRWFVLDLGEKRSFSHVRLRAQNNRIASKMFSEVEVRIGNERVQFPDDFFSYTFFGKFIGPAYANQEIDLTTSSPVQARFISVQRFVSRQHFQVCHVEVF